MEAQQAVWVFNGEGARFPGAIFLERELAEKWIKLHKLTGILTLYPLNEGVYDWSVSNGQFAPKNEEQKASAFIQRFTSASQEHYHYEDGQPG